MFNKKPRRNFRQRKDDSSDEEEEQKNSGDGEKTEKASSRENKPFNDAQADGFSRREATPSKSDSSDGDDEVTLGMTEDVKEKGKVKERNKKTNPTLSFSDDKEGL